MRPLNGLIKVKLIEQTVTKGGIHLPEIHKTGLLSGLVLDVGGGSYERNGQLLQMDVFEGDTVHFMLANLTETIPFSKEYLVHYTALWAKQSA